MFPRSSSYGMIMPVRHFTCYPQRKRPHDYSGCGAGAIETRAYKIGSSHCSFEWSSEQINTSIDKRWIPKGAVSSCAQTHCGSPASTVGEDSSEEVVQRLSSSPRQAILGLPFFSLGIRRRRRKSCSLRKEDLTYCDRVSGPEGVSSPTVFRFF